MNRRPGPTVRSRVVEHVLDGSGDEVTRRREDRLVGEEPLELRLTWPGAAPRRAWVTMRTPGHDFELAAGWVRHEGLVDDTPGAVAGVAYCTDADLTEEQAYNTVTVTLAAPPLRDLAHRHEASSAGSSACGVCGADSLADALSVAAPGGWTGPLPAADVVRSLPDRLRAAQAVFDRTGGSHAAALCTADGEVLVVREDVGRHNAVDKVTGARVLAGLSPAEACLVVSGRAGFELVQKAVAAGTGSLVAVGAPTSLSVRLAAEHGLALWAFTRPDRVVRYAG
ncbi:formate dehydrogenase accessory sulfurtransferase FdhD [Nocardioides sp.]|uniref:formate dehydrogenase accessory sulfurtransferase FdhD n=1 Tax=Nocardioides sp. TaxID=35761 RepID=UPI00260422A1|nr:formate dehydrogenase accessory sulfurtransferase FdhD [Nocardioides sp.]